MSIDICTGSGIDVQMAMYAGTDTEEWVQVWMQKWIRYRYKLQVKVK